MTDADGSHGLPPDHPFVSETGPRSMRDALNARLANNHVASGARADLAAATRTIIDELMRSTADDSSLEQASVLVARAADLLRRDSHGRDYTGVAEGSLSIGQQSFIDYSPFIGVLNPLAPPMTVEFDDDGNVIATCAFGAAYEGPPGCLHGGFIAAAFDEVLGFAQAYSGKPGMTGRLTISYHSPTPLFREVRFIGRLDRVDGRKIHASATLSAGDTLCAKAEGLFISMKADVLQKLLWMRGGQAADTQLDAPAPGTVSGDSISAPD
jgi:acyl-coenzyme A thioesterase PaaI-like protein